MEKRYQDYKAQGYKQYLLINDASGFGSKPTSTYCKQIRDMYGLTFPVLFDPTGAFTAAYGFTGSNEQNIVLDEGGVIIYKKRYANQNEVKTVIEGAL